VVVSRANLAGNARSSHPGSPRRSGVTSVAWMISDEHVAAGSSATLALLPVSNFIPDGATLVTAPIGVPSDGRCQRSKLLRSALRTLNWFQRVIIVARSRQFPRTFECHDSASRARMISAIVRSGRCVQTNRKKGFGEG